MRAGRARALLAAVLLAVLATGSAQGRGPRPDRQVALPAVSLRVADTTAARVVRRGVIRVRVRLRQAGMTRLYAVLRARAGGAPIVITRTRDLRLGGGRWHTVRLRLLRVGRAALSGCAAQTVEARALKLHG